MHANTSSEALLAALHLISATPLYGYVVATYINFIELTNLFLLSLKIRHFMKQYTMKTRSHTISNINLEI